MKKIIKKSIYLGVVATLFSGIISCEKDFTDIGTGVIDNTKFETDAVTVGVTIENSPLNVIQSDNIRAEQGQYLLGVFNKADYEKIEASIVSQVAINTGLKLTDKTYGADTTVISTIDTVYLKLPYQATLESNTSSPDFSLDSIIGNPLEAFTLNIYQNDTYLNRLDPSNPSQLNKYYSNSVFQKVGSELNSDINYQFTPNKNDTLIVVKRRLNDGTEYAKDTIKYAISGTNDTPLPFARIPLKEDAIKQLFLDKYESSEFASQEAFNNYFRGLILEATGNEGSLISFNFTPQNANLQPSIEVYYTNTVVKSGNIVIDTIRKNNSFSLAGLRSNTYKMQDRTYPTNNQVVLQGTAGSEGKVTIFGADSNSNGIADKIEELRAENLLVNDASLTFYINQSADTTALPYSLYLYKVNSLNGSTSFSQIKDTYSEGIRTFNGLLQRDEDGKVEKYTFKLTDYVSDLLSGETNYLPELRLKIANVSDYPQNDTIFRNYSWNPKAITLFNNLATKKPELKISYSKKTN